MGIIRRKKTPPPLVEEEGNANLAKQVQVSAHAAKQQVQAAPNTGPSQVRTESTALSDPEAVIYKFKTTLTANHQRSTRWYIAWSIFFALAVGVNVWMGLYLSAVVIVLLGTLVFVNASKKTKEIDVKITSKGISVGETSYTWRDIENFWILHDPPLNQLLFKRRSGALREVSVELGTENPLKIRDLLLAYVPEDATREEGNIDFLTRALKL